MNACFKPLHLTSLQREEETFFVSFDYKLVLIKYKKKAKFTCSFYITSYMPLNHSIKT